MDGFRLVRTQDPRPDVASARPVLVLGSSQATPLLSLPLPPPFLTEPELALLIERQVSSQDSTAREFVYGC